jgi:hypothetical protein
MHQVIMDDNSTTLVTITKANLRGVLSWICANFAMALPIMASSNLHWFK